MVTRGAERRYDTLGISARKGRGRGLSSPPDDVKPPRRGQPARLAAGRSRSVLHTDAPRGVTLPPDAHLVVVVVA